MEGVKVSIDRVVVDFTNVYWTFFNPLRQWLCHYYNAAFYVKDKGFKYRVRVREGKHWAYLSYQLVYARLARKHTLRLECPPDSLIHFQSWISEIGNNATDILHVRSEVAFDIPLPLSELFVLSLTGRNMKKRKGTFYSNKRHQRQVAGYCRVYDKRLELLQRRGVRIEGELTRFEIVYKPDEKIPMSVLVQYPPRFNKLYLCAQAISVDLLKPKLQQRVNGLMRGELEQRKLRLITVGKSWSKCGNRNMSTKKAEDILSLVQQDGDTSKDYQEANDFLVKNVVQDLIIRDHQLRQIDTALAKHLALLDYKLETMHGISTVTAAELIAEIGDISRFSSADKLANFAGIAPVQHSSGNKQKSKKSKLGNRSLYDIFYNLAIRQLGVSRAKKPNHPVYHAYYERKLAEGKTKWQAIICVMRKLVNVIYSMMKYKTEYKMPVLTEQAA